MWVNLSTGLRGSPGSCRLCRTLFISLIILTAFTAPGFALDPNQPAASYLRTDFTDKDGLSSNVVNAIVQTQNGLLWLGTGGGLVSFNGHRFIPLFRGRELAVRSVHALATTPDGDLWVGSEIGLVRIPSAALDHFDFSLSTLYHPGDGASNCLHVSRDGVLWVGTNQGLYRMDRGSFVPIIPRVPVSRIEEAPDGHLFIPTGQGYLEWDGTHVLSHPGLATILGVPADAIFDVFEDRNGILWYCTVKGVARQSGASLERVNPYGAPGRGALQAYQDQQGNVWIAQKAGLFRATAAELEPLAPGLHVMYLYADRDGDLWVGTNGEGLVRFRDRTIRMFTSADGLPSNVPMTVLSSHDGKLWVGNNCGGLSWFDGQRFKTYNEKDGLLNSCVWSLAEDPNHDLWIGTWGGGLFRFRDGRFTQYSKPQGLPSSVVRCVVAARDGSLWIATPDGLSHLESGRFRNYTTADGLSSDRVVAVYQDHSGGVWAGTATGIDRLTGDRFVSVPQDPELFDRHYHSLAEDSFGNLYAFSQSNGINRIEGNRLLRLHEGMGPAAMVQSNRQDLWLTGGSGIFRFAASDFGRAEQSPDSPLDYASFGTADGLNTEECSAGLPNMAITPDGRLWVTTVQGLAMLDLSRLQRSARKPAILLEDVTVDRKAAFAGPELVLPPGNHHVELHFDAVELRSPEKISLQYRLDDVDPVWLDASSDTPVGAYFPHEPKGPAGIAIYSNVPAGAHSFHIRACNRDGVWDRDGIVYNVIQQPFLYQTIWFKLAAVACLGLFLAGLYFLRLRQVAVQIQRRIEERLGERVRIARELHDTFLQSVHGLILCFQAVADRIPESEPARQMIEQALDRADQVLVEGRDRVKSLRTSGEAVSDLSQALAQTGQELAHDSGAEFSVLVEGNPKGLHPVVRDEAYWIGREALVNAFQHAGASLIEVEVAYDRRELRLRFRDDGRGLDAEILEAGGRPGHWGMPGMRERAHKIGAQFEAWSRPGAGTEVELRVPGAMAYRSRGGGTRWQRFFAAVRRGGMTDGDLEHSD
jgi:ligand-binding sensor domain-containing protein